MDISILISGIEDAKKELLQTLASGVEFDTDYQRIVGEIRGLDKSKSIISEAFERANNGEDEFP